MQLRVVEETENKYSEEGGTFINMFDAHPPFQIDGNFGAAAGIAEMLLQSRDDKIFVLPALPDAWKRGGVKGLCAKGGVRVDISWDENKVEAVLVSDIDQTIRVAFRGLKHSDVILKKNEAKAIVL